MSMLVAYYHIYLLVFVTSKTVCIPNLPPQCLCGRENTFKVRWPSIIYVHFTKFMMPLGGCDALPCLILLVLVLRCILMDTSKMFPFGNVTQSLFLKPCKTEQWGRYCKQRCNKRAALCHIYIQFLSIGACTEE